MILKKILICITLLHSTLLLFGQAEFKNVVVTSSEGRVTIDYDLQPTVERAVLKAVRLTVVSKGETIVPKTVGGAIGTDVSFGLGRRLIWDCAADGRLLSGKAEILLEADCEVLPPPQPAVGPERDSDGDGTPDKKDKCPNEFGEPEDGGCPNYSPIELLAIRAIDSAKRVGAEELSLSGLELKRLPSSIKSLTQLKKLDLTTHQISDLSALKTLTHLEDLNVMNNKIRDISVLKTFVNLTYLYLGINPISDISALKTLVNLTNLNLYDTKISDISALNGFRQLYDLDVTSTQISDMSIFKDLNLTQLRTLRVSYNKISNLSALRYLEQLERLDLISTQISDASEIEALNLKQLTHLALQDNNIQNFNVNLKVFPKLQNLFLSGNPIQNIPKEIIGQGLGDNCLEALRAYQAKQKR